MLTDPNRRRTKLQERSLALMTEALERERIYTDAYARARAIVPEDWHFHEMDAPCKPRKTKVTIRLDADMVRWFRHLGFGYQKRMNVVLRAYMNAVIAKYVESAGDRDATGKSI
jgi:uncharacterized protein (DUF4415 family)